MLMANPSMGLIVPPGPQPTANLGLNPGALPDFNQLLSQNDQVGQTVIPASQPDNIIQINDTSQQDNNLINMQKILDKA